MCQAPASIYNPAMPKPRLPVAVTLAALVSACASEPAGPLALAQLPEIDGAAAFAHIGTLSSDE